MVVYIFYLNLYKKLRPKNGKKNPKSQFLNPMSMLDYCQFIFKYFVIFSMENISIERAKIALYFIYKENCFIKFCFHRTEIFILGKSNNNFIYIFFYKS